MEPEGANSNYEEYSCPICLNLIISPILTACNHLFCKYCLEDLFELNANSTENKCPLCRTVNELNSDNLQVNHEIEEKIKSKFKDDYLKREAKIKIVRASKFKLKIDYGNEHKQLLGVSGNAHKWKVFVRIEEAENEEDYYIEKVTFKLHPTFGQSLRTIRHSPFELEANGWGVFNIPIKIYWQPRMRKEPTKLEHYLSFNGDGEFNRIIEKFEIKNNNQEINN